VGIGHSGGFGSGHTVYVAGHQCEIGRDHRSVLFGMRVTSFITQSYWSAETVFYRVVIVEINPPDPFWAVVSGFPFANPSTTLINNFHD
jgi:hypothetical protein